MYILCGFTSSSWRITKACICTRYMTFRFVHSRREHRCLYSCTLMIWNIWSHEPAVIMPSLSWEESQGEIPAIVSGKGFLACTTNLPTHKGKRGGKLDSERRHCSKSFWIGSGCWHWRLKCLTPSVPLRRHQLQLESGLAQTAGWRLFLLGWNL